MDRGQPEMGCVYHKRSRGKTREMKPHVGGDQLFNNLLYTRVHCVQFHLDVDINHQQTQGTAPQSNSSVPTFVEVGRAQKWSSSNQSHPRIVSDNSETS